MRRQTRKGGGKQIDLTLDAMGARGDATGILDDGTPLFVPFALPGERVRIRTAAKSDAGVRGELLELLEESPERVDPPCPNFGPCGGCQLQHWQPLAEQAWKEELVRTAVTRAGYEPSCVQPLIRPESALRRRARLVSAGSKVGFRERRGKAIATIAGCLTLEPSLLDFATKLKPPKGEAEWTVTSTLAGLDISVQSKEAAPDPLATQDLLHDLPKAARLTWNGELLLEIDAPRVDFGGLSPVLPGGGFLQPSLGGQAALQQAVLNAIPEDADWVADLYCGLGTFAIPLAARGHRVQAMESHEPAIAALDAAVRRDPSNTLKIHVGLRDLDLYPLRTEELEGFDAAIFDPPRAGARSQAKHLANSGIETVVAVSCNPTTWARDAALLREGGYALASVQPVDQFPFTSHLELVAVFMR